MTDSTPFNHIWCSSIYIVVLCFRRTKQNNPKILPSSSEHRRIHLSNIHMMERVDRCYSRNKNETKQVAKFFIGRDFTPYTCIENNKTHCAGRGMKVEKGQKHRDRSVLKRQFHRISIGWWREKKKKGQPKRKATLMTLDAFIFGSIITTCVHPGVGRCVLVQQVMVPLPRPPSLLPWK